MAAVNRASFLTGHLPIRFLCFDTAPNLVVNGISGVVTRGRIICGGEKAGSGLLITLGIHTPPTPFQILILKVSSSCSMFFFYILCIKGGDAKIRTF